jgi:hypothetical protein
MCSCFQEDGGTGLTFASGSHRDFALPFWSRPHESGADFASRYADSLSDHGQLRVGDVTWHHGWTLVRSLIDTCCVLLFKSKYVLLFFNSSTLRHRTTRGSERVMLLEGKAILDSPYQFRSSLMDVGSNLIRGKPVRHRCKDRAPATRTLLVMVLLQLWLQWTTRIARVMRHG